MLYDNIFSEVGAKIKEAGTDDPKDVASYFDIMWIPLHGSITGYAASYGRVYAIGINEKLSGSWLKFAAWHELAHIFAGHVSSENLPDKTCFSQEVDSLTIPKHERTANLISADVCVNDDDVFSVTNYNSETMCAYRRMRSYQKGLLLDLDSLRLLCGKGKNSGLFNARMQELKHRIESTGRALSDIENEINSLNCGRTFHDMAVELGINERIFRYKLEAMRLKGLDIDRQELESYSSMFDEAFEDSRNSVS